MRIKVRFSEDKPFRVKFSEDKRFKVSFGTIQNITEYVGGELYEGAYEVTPRLHKQALFTAEKVMLHDVTINEIPLVTTSNPSGGKTLIIGG